MICQDCLIRDMARVHVSYRTPPFKSHTLWRCECGAVRFLDTTMEDVEWESLRRVARARAAFERWAAVRQNAAPARAGIKSA